MKKLRSIIPARELEASYPDVSVRNLNRTGAYKFTYRAGSEEGEQAYADLKAKLKGTDLSARRFGRLGRDSPHRHLYAHGGPLHRRSSQMIKPEHASRFDVYVTPRRQRDSRENVSETMLVRPVRRNTDEQGEEQ